MNIATAISQLYPQVVRIVGSENPIAYDADGNEVIYDIDAVNAKIIEAEQAAIATKQSAIAKLTAIGLTADEIAALGVK